MYRRFQNRRTVRAEFALVVQSCENKEPESFCVPKYNPENWDFTVHSSPMLKMIGKCVSGKRIRHIVQMEDIIRNITWWNLI